MEIDISQGSINKTECSTGAAMMESPHASIKRVMNLNVFVYTFPPVVYTVAYELVGLNMCLDGHYSHPFTINETFVFRNDYGTPIGMKISSIINLEINERSIMASLMNSLGRPVMHINIAGLVHTPNNEINALHPEYLTEDTVSVNRLTRYMDMVDQRNVPEEPSVPVMAEIVMPIKRPRVSNAWSNMEV